MEQHQLRSMAPKKYVLRSLTFKNLIVDAVNVVISKETINKPFVIVSALLYGLTFKNLDASKFDYSRMGFTDQYSFLKKVSLLSFNGDGGDLVNGQLWMFPDLTDFEMTVPNVYLLESIVNPDFEFPIVHILESQ